MNRFDKCTEIMHDLLLIQSDRKAVYERIVKWPDIDQSIKNHLDKLIIQCRNCILELRRHIDMTGCDPADRADIRGYIYREWPGISNFPSSTSNTDFISLLELKEKEVVLAYQMALQQEEVLREECKTMVNDQLGYIHRSFGKIMEHKEQPLEPAVITEEEKPFQLFRSKMFFETTVHFQPAEVSER